MSNFTITQKELLANPQTLAGALESRGVTLEKTCGGRGICGSCKCKKVKGEVHYLREPIAAFDADTEVLPCISLPSTVSVVLSVA